MARRRARQRSFEELLSLFEKTIPRSPLRPGLQGFAYRFTIILPLLSASGKEMFSPYQVSELAKLFDRHFGGCLVTAFEGQPPWWGTWLPPRRKKSIVDRHALLVVYLHRQTKQPFSSSILKSTLEEAGLQEAIVIELTPVRLLEGAELPG